MVKHLAVPVPYDDFDIATPAASEAAQSQVFGGSSWHDSDDGVDTGSEAGGSQAVAIHELEMERLAWLQRYWSTDRGFNLRLVSTADCEFPGAENGPLPRDFTGDESSEEDEWRHSFPAWA